MTTSGFKSIRGIAGIKPKTMPTTIKNIGEGILSFSAKADAPNISDMMIRITV